MAVVRVPVEDDNGNSVWPDKFPNEELAFRRENMGDLRYAQQYLILPVSLTGNELNLSWLRFYDPADLDDDKWVGYYLGVDPSISGTGDYMVICVLRKAEDGKMYIEDFIREKATLDRTIELIEHTAMLYPPNLVNVEAVGAQAFLVQQLQERTALPIRAYAPKGSKEDRIRLNAQVYFGSGKVFLRGQKDIRSDNDKALVADDRMSAFLGEWLGFPRGRHDDTLDAAITAIDAASSSGQAVSLAADSEDDTKLRWVMRSRRWLY